MIQINICQQYAIKEINKLLKHGLLPPEQVTRPENIIIDMSSPNIAKEMHVGHLRSTLIGEALSKLFSFVGHNVQKINHIGDWGTQFGMLIAYFKQNQKNLDSLNELPEIQQMYKEAKALFDSDTDFAKESLKCVTKLQNKEPEAYQIWKKIVDLSMSSNYIFHLPPELKIVFFT